MTRATAPVRSRLATAARIAWLLVLPAIDASGAGPVVGWGLGQPPNPVNGIDGTASAIAAGEFYDQRICAIQAETGAVVCWGENLLGSDTPPDAVNGTDGTASAIAAGRYHACAIQTGTGAVVCWESIPGA